MKKWIRYGFFTSLLFLARAQASVDSAESLNLNKLIVKKFYDLAFNRHDPKTAALQYLSADYRQHNPYVETGRQAFIAAFAGEKDEGSAKFIRFIAEVT